jgi:HlyD family secretion protein
MAMTKNWIKRGIGFFVLAVIAGATIYALMPQPVGVDVAVIDRGAVEVSVDEEGVARIRDIFRVSTPIAGRVQRLPIKPGDEVRRGVATIALIRPSDPPFLDARTRQELSAIVEAASAGVDLAESQMNSAVSTLELAKSNHSRAERLIASGGISERAFEEASTALSMAEAELRQAEASLVLRQFQLSAAEARMIEPDGAAVDTDPETCCVVVTAPSDGVVISVLSQSEQVLPAGAPLAEIGDPGNIEIVAHLISADAVKISEGVMARLDEWGGGSLAARVRRVSPAAYTKVSALGIEEQRVDVVLDLVDPHEAWSRLGHEFRVMVHIPLWRGEDVVRVPIGALVRSGSAWAVYRIVEGAAKILPVAIDHRNNQWAEVTDGLTEGDEVVLHPSDRVTDGVGVVAY